MSDSLWPHGLYSPWNSPGQDTGVGSLFLLQWIFPTQKSNQGLLHCRQILYQLSYQENPKEGRVPKNWGFWTLVLEKIFESPLDSKEINQSVLNIHWKDWCWRWSSNNLATWCNSQLMGKDPGAGKDWRQKKKRATEDEKVGWHHQFNGHELGQTLGVGEW